MTVQEAYKNYCDKMQDKHSDLDPISLDIDWFIKTLITDDKFDKEWSNGCTEELSKNEKNMLYKRLDTNDKWASRVAKRKIKHTI